MKILIVDDQRSNRMLLRAMLEQEGHECSEAENGLMGVDLFSSFQPDLVLMDVIMPVMDGYQATQAIKEKSKDYHVPIIFLTAASDEASLLQCLESGGDDFLAKPINDLILKAKIKAHSRTQYLTEQIRSKNTELTILHETLHQEHEMGQHVLNHALQRNVQNSANVHSYLSSMSTFNGDLLLVAEKPSGGLYVVLADFTGHGLGAAIGAIPLSQAFFSMADKDIALVDIAREINKVLKSFLPSFMFCAANFVEINERGDQMSIWSGGLPNSFIIRPSEGVIGQIKSQHVALGIVGDDHFCEEVDIIDLQENDRVLMMTDGILEASCPNGDMFGQERIVGAIAEANSDYFERVLDSYHAHIAKTAQEDDISLIELMAKPVAYRH